MLGTKYVTVRFGNLPIEDLKAIEGYAEEITLWGYEGGDCYYTDITFRVDYLTVNRYGLSISNDREDWDVKIDFHTDEFDPGFFVDILLGAPDMEYAVEVPFEVFEQFYYDNHFNSRDIATWWKKRTGSTRG